MDHTYILQSTHTQSYQRIIKYQIKHSISNQLCYRAPLNTIKFSGIYTRKLECKTCNKSYVGQTGSSMGIRHGERTRYIKSNNRISAYASHILNNRHEYGNPERTTQLFNTCSRGKKMNCW